MAVTPNYSWPVPVATDYVKDGYSAIADLGDAIDATVFALPAPASGLTFISATTIGTTVASVTVTNAFSTTYDDYLILIDGATMPVAGNNFFMAFNNGTGNNYKYATAELNYANTPYNQSTTGVSQGIIIGFTTVDNCFSSSITVFRPFLTGVTALNCLTSYSGGVLRAGGLNNQSLSHTAFSILPSSGTITGGTIRVYGYQKA